MKLFILLFLAAAAFAQESSPTSVARRVRTIATLPATCNPVAGEVFFQTTGEIGVFACTALNTWTRATGTSGTPGYSIYAAYANDTNGTSCVVPPTSTVGKTHIYLKQLASAPDDCSDFGVLTGNFIKLEGQDGQNGLNACMAGADAADGTGFVIDPPSAVSAKRYRATLRISAACSTLTMDDFTNAGITTFTDFKGAPGGIQGPGSSTLLAVPKYSNTSGTEVTNTGVLISATNRMTAPGGYDSGDGSTPGFEVHREPAANGNAGFGFLALSSYTTLTVPYLFSVADSLPTAPYVWWATTPADSTQDFGDGLGPVAVKKSTLTPMALSSATAAARVVTSGQTSFVGGRCVETLANGNVVETSGPCGGGSLTPLTSGRLMLAPTGVGATTQSSVVATTQIRLLELMVSYPITIGRIAFNLIAGIDGSTTAIGIYNSSCTLVAQTGALPTAIANQGIRSATFTGVTLQPGKYWVGWGGDNTGVTFSGFGVASIYATLGTVDTANRYIAVSTAAYSSVTGLPSSCTTGLANGSFTTAPQVIIQP